MCMTYYDLDPVYSRTSLNFFWDAALKMTHVKLELLTEDDSEIYSMFEESKRGGISGTGSNKFVINIDCPNDIKQKLYEQCLKQKIKIQTEEGFID